MELGCLDNLEWTDPPPRKSTGRQINSAYQALADKLRANPGQWAKVLAGAPNTSAATTLSKGAAFTPRGAFEATTRRDEQGNYDIYARYVGEAAPEQDVDIAPTPGGGIEDGQ